MTKAKNPVAKYGHPTPKMRSNLSRINTFYAHDRCTSTSREIDTRVIRVILGVKAEGNGFELEISVDTNNPFQPELSIRSNDGRLIIKPEVANRVTIRAEH